MDNKPMSLKIMLWAEIIVSARILLFVAPLVIHKAMTGTWGHAIETYFLASIGAPAALYLVVGIVSLAGHQRWRFLHYIVITMSFLQTAALAAMIIRTGHPLFAYHFIPAEVSLLILLFLYSVKKKSA